MSAVNITPLDAAELEAVKRTLREQRSFFVELPGRGWAVQMRLPLFAEIGDAGLIDAITVEHVVQFAIGWRGATGAHFIGAAGGSSPLPFDRELWAEWVRDEPDCIAAVVVQLAERLAASLQAKQEAGKV